MKRQIKLLQIAGVLSVLMALIFSVVTVQKVLAAPPGGTTTTYWVNDTGDAPDANPGDNVCDTGTGALPGTGRLPCTLRAAIQEANNSAGAQVIAFEICPTDFVSNGDVAGSYRISPVTPLPAVTGGLTYFNGYTQGYGQVTTGYDDPSTTAPACNGVTSPRLASPNTISFGLALNTVLAVEVDGTACVSPVPENDLDQTTAVSGGVIPSGSIIQWNLSAGACSGLTVTSDRNVFAGLNIRNWDNAGILIMPLVFTSDPNRPSENSVWGDFIGTNATGDAAQANRFGVAILGGSNSNYIGDTLAIPTWGVGDANWVEEPTNNERNLISGNDNPNLIYGYTCAEGGGLTNFRDDGAGVFLGVDPCIRQNGSDQTDIFIGGAIDNHVRNSYIGTDYQGEVAVPNSSGVWLNYDAGADILDVDLLPGNHIGGCVSFPFIVGTLSGGCEPQTVDEEQDPNLISGNRRLTSGGAQQTLGGHGVWLNGFTSDTAHRDGAADVSYNEIAGNIIGLDVAGTSKLPNSGNGVYVLANQTLIGVDGPDSNEIGATTEYLPYLYPYLVPYTDDSYRYGNVISGNGDSADSDGNFGRWDNGVELRGSGATLNRVAYGNTIGLNSQGTNLPNDVGNGEAGVFIWFGANNNYTHNNSGSSISSPYAAPLGAADAVSTFGAISDNGDFSNAALRHGIVIVNSAQFNHVFRNCIGGDAVDTPGGVADDCEAADLGNHFSGVYIGGAATHNWIGFWQWTVANDPQPNWIHHNFSDGVTVVDSGTRGNAIRFNSIWLNGPAPADDGDLGIDLSTNNDTANDGADADAGPNDVQNYPDNRVKGAHWLVSFTQPAGCSAATCRIDIYATLVSESDWTNSPAIGDPQTTNNGEGRYWLRSNDGSATNLDISAEVQAALGNPPPENVCISLTTTRTFGGFRNTSEFSPCMGFLPTAIELTTAKASPVTSALVGLLAGVTLLAAVGLLFLRRRRA